MMKGDWLLVLALRDRAAKESLPVVEEEEYGDLAIWLQQKFDGYFAILVKKKKKKHPNAGCIFYTIPII